MYKKISHLLFISSFPSVLVRKRQKCKLYINITQFPPEKFVPRLKWLCAQGQKKCIFFFCAVLDKIIPKRRRRFFPSNNNKTKFFYGDIGDKKFLSLSLSFVLSFIVKRHILSSTFIYYIFQLHFGWSNLQAKNILMYIYSFLFEGERKNICATQCFCQFELIFTYEKKKKKNILCVGDFLARNNDVEKNWEFPLMQHSLVSLCVTMKHVALLNVTETLMSRNTPHSIFFYFILFLFVWIIDKRRGKTIKMRKKSINLSLSFAFIGIYERKESMNENEKLKFFFSPINFTLIFHNRPLNEIN